MTDWSVGPRDPVSAPVDVAKRPPSTKRKTLRTVAKRLELVDGAPYFVRSFDNVQRLCRWEDDKRQFVSVSQVGRGGKRRTPIDTSTIACVSTGGSTGRRRRWFTLGDCYRKRPEPVELESVWVNPIRARALGLPVASPVLTVMVGKVF
jgi:hypothetical protein